jgi:hypothetical protein
MAAERDDKKHSDTPRCDAKPLGEPWDGLARQLERELTGALDYAKVLRDDLVARSAEVLMSESSLHSKASAWDKIQAKLTELTGSEEWLRGEGNGTQCAIAVIERFARSAIVRRPRPGEGTECELGPHHCEFPECSCPSNSPDSRSAK